MPTIIDRSIFKGKLFIPNVQNVPDIHNQGTQPTNQDKLTAAIEKYERLLLVNALGYTQYDLLIANINQESGKWFDLINGTTYDGKRFDGLKEIIAYYTYVNFLKYDNVQYNTTGLERSDAANSTSVSPTERLIDYWNTFVHKYQSFSYCGCGGINTGNRNFVSLYQYLNDKLDDYTINNFAFYQVQNVLGIW